MAKIDLTKYGITGTTEIVYNPSYETLFEEETKPELEGFEKGQVSELGAVNVMTGIYTGRSPKDKYIVPTLIAHKLTPAKIMINNKNSKLSLILFVFNIFVDRLSDLSIISSY